MDHRPATLRSADDLVAAGLAAPESRAALERVASRYAVAITSDLAGLIDSGDADDPVARQFVPDPAELETRPEELLDPIGDEAHSPVPGIVHRYPDRVLLKAVSACAVYCRFCFRRETVGPGQGEALAGPRLEAALAYIASRPEVWEVILSGGDPLVLSRRRLDILLGRLAAIPHLRVVRVHTRLPVADPDRVTPALVRTLRQVGRPVWLVLHANHAREISPAVEAALGRLADGGIPLLSQSVLLAGVNDDPASLEALMRRLVECRVKPYYLHHPDLAPGTARFRTSVAAGQRLVGGLRGRVSGLCQPTYVLDIPGGHGKSPLGPCQARALADGATEVTDWQGRGHRYDPPGG